MHHTFPTKNNKVCSVNMKSVDVISISKAKWHIVYTTYQVKKIGVTNNLEERVTRQQGYTEDEYEILDMSDDICYISHKEIELTKRIWLQSRS